MLGLMAPDYLEREVFCRGPEPFMRGVKESLAALGFDLTRYHQESFGPPETAPAPEVEAPEIRFTASGVSTACAPGETVLAAAKRAGLNIPSGCNFGLCGTCKVRKTAGGVQMLHNGGISEDDIAAGCILACGSRPLGKVAVEI
ncbi:2Fe-2S iron-sulfur cluster protein [Rhodobacter capsulatus]|nr:2Fe-2S iron-sulfur cluster protein [Rhodobacter capsulatus]